MQCCTLVSNIPDVLIEGAVNCIVYLASAQISSDIGDRTLTMDIIWGVLATVLSMCLVMCCGSES